MIVVFQTPWERLTGRLYKSNYLMIMKDGIAERDSLLSTYKLLSITRFNSGSQNDKSLFERSQFGIHVHKVLPNGLYFLGDAGYKLMGHLLTPYPIRLNMTEEEAHYNLVHSGARNCVERAFARWKNKFRLFKSEFTHHTPEDMARLIEATMILHNWYIEIQKAYEGSHPEDEDVPHEDWMHFGGDEILAGTEYRVDGSGAEARRHLVKDYLYRFVET
ncbi:hypothetical protein AeRB84_002645 [Aphanomyces euteiches]|nr:hypothetical protein AeRB84_002645 [Aphanomyces euteiches]